jgi:hypothetical protein
MLYRDKRNANDPEADRGNVLESKSLKILTRTLTNFSKRSHKMGARGSVVG